MGTERGGSGGSGERGGGEGGGGDGATKATDLDVIPVTARTGKPRLAARVEMG